MRERNSVIDFVLTCVMIGGTVYILAVLGTKWFSGSVLG